MAQQTIWQRAREWLVRTFTLREPVEVWGLPRSRAGVRVGVEDALAYSAVYNAVTIYAQTVATLPLHVYRVLPDGSKERLTGHPVQRLLHERPNPALDSYRWRETMMVHLLLWGNAYAEIMEQDGSPVELWPIPPWLVRPRLEGRDVVYEVAQPGASSVVLGSKQVFHVAGLGFDGLQGKSVIGLARESLGLALAAERFGAQFFGSGANMSGVLAHPGTLSETALENLRRQWHELYSGLDNAHRIAILEEGMRFERISIPPEDAQFLQVREHQVEEVARWFNMPPTMLKDLRRATFSNAEQEALSFVKYSLLPWLRRIESAIKHQLLSGTDQADLFAEFTVEGLLRGDTATRYTAYATARQWGWLSANDIRRLENLDPVEGGDVYLQPLNMVAAGSAPSGAAPVQAGPGIEQRAAQARRRLRDAYRPLIEDAARRLVRREVREVRRAARRIWGARDRQQWDLFLERYYADFEPVIRDVMGPVLRSMSEQVHAEAMDEISSTAPIGPDYERFVTDYLASSAARWSQSSAGQLRALGAPGDTDPLEAIEERLDEWEETRASKIAESETVQAGEAFAKAAWALAGVVALQWSASGEACPLCLQLDGRTVGIEAAFLGAGQTLSAPGASPLTTSSSVGNPPLHNGCVCQIVAVAGLRSSHVADARAVLAAILAEEFPELTPQAQGQGP